MNGPTLTLGEFRALTRDLPDDTPLTVYDPENWWYVNINLTQESVDLHLQEDGQPSVILDLSGPVDTRQW